MKQIQQVRTPTGNLALIRPTAEKLLKEGVISGELDGELHANDAATVKAAIMASSVCDFCSTPGASHYYDVPDFGITTNSRGGTNYSPMVGTSEGGWMACDVCHDLIERNRRKDLTERAISTHAFPKFSRRAIEELYTKFWQGMDDRAEAMKIGRIAYDFVEDRLSEATKAPQYDSREKRVYAAMRGMELTRQELETVVKGEMTRDLTVKLMRWRQKLDPTKRMELERLVGYLDAPPPLPTHTVPHWQTALDMKLKAYGFLNGVVKSKDKSMAGLGFTNDVKVFQRAQAYSFNGETIAAIQEAAKSVPHDAPLSSIEVPAGGAGWFWFGEPIQIKASPTSDVTVALLWGWQKGELLYRLAIPAEFLENAEGFDPVVIEETKGPNPPMLTKLQVDSLSEVIKQRGVTQEQMNEWLSEIEGPPAMAFTAYVLDDKKVSGIKTFMDVPIPSTRWVWQFEETFHEMLARNGASWDERYGPGKPYENVAALLNRGLTIKCVAELSLFFLMSCLWFRQTVERPPVLERKQGPMERQERKRMQKEYKLDAIPSVQVVALRRTARSQEPVEHREGESKREYHFRWIVQGHARLQACGPGRKDRKLIWIDAYPKGPEDKPLKTREKVYAVVR